MQALDKALQTYFLGRDFLTWLWFKSETNEGRFKLDLAGDVEVWFDGPLTLQSEGSVGAEKVVCSSDALTEARLALSEGRKVAQATLRIRSGSDEWVCVIDSLWMNLRSVKPPKTAGGDDYDAQFYERVFLLERLTAVIDDLYSAFLSLRLSPEWRKEELPALRAWSRELTQH